MTTRLPTHQRRMTMQAAGILCLCLPSLCTTAAEVTQTPQEAVSSLGWELVARSGEGNAIVSPVSVWQALAMTHAGAAGETASEIARLLGMPDDKAAIAEASLAMRKAFEQIRSEEIRLSIANRLWLQEGQPIAADFTGILVQTTLLQLACSTLLVRQRPPAMTSIAGWPTRQRTGSRSYFPRAPSRPSHGLSSRTLCL